MAADQESKIDISSDGDTNGAPEISSKAVPAVAAVTEPTIAAGEESTGDYISGMRLFVVTASVTLVCFLMLLDMSIIVTVRQHSANYQGSLHPLAMLLLTVLS
jgi:hypothetical protein